MYSTYYDISYPALERSSARKLRLSPVYNGLKSWISLRRETGWERPTGLPRTNPWIGQGWPVLTVASRYWSPVSAPSTRRPLRCSHVRTNFFQQDRGTRPRLAAFLTAHHDNQMDQPIELHLHANAQRAWWIECDLTAPRLAADRFQIITARLSAITTLWIRQPDAQR